MRGNRKWLIFAVICICLSTTGCYAGEASQDGKETAEIFAMNTIMDLTVYGEHSSDILDEAKQIIRQYEQLFSVNVESSDVARLNKAGGSPVQVSGETYDLIQESLAISKRTDGLFDISIYPLVRAWGFTTENYRVPDETESGNLLGAVGYSGIQLLGNRTVCLPAQMQIDLGGIAKGYLSQKLVGLFQKREAEAAVISLGGNVQTFGKKPDGTPFTVGITDPADGRSLLGTIEVGERAVITSGSYQRYFEQDGVVYHHIMDTRTGAPADSDLTSVTVLSDNGECADGLATALFVMGKEKAIAFDRENEDVQCILVDQKNEVWVSEGITFQKN